MEQPDGGRKCVQIDLERHVVGAGLDAVPKQVSAGVPFGNGGSKALTLGDRTELRMYFATHIILGLTEFGTKALPVGDSITPHEAEWFQEKIGWWFVLLM